MTDIPNFDRRSTDASIEALATRVAGLEGRVENLELQGKDNSRSLAENNAMTREMHDAIFGVDGEFTGVAGMARQVHDAVFGTDGKPGVQATVKEIYELVDMGKSVFRFADRWGTRLGAASDWISKTLRRFWWLIAVVIAAATYIKTGKLPDWPVFPQ